MATSSGVILQSPSIQNVFEKAKRLAQYPSTVLIEGETGVGKEVMADWIHQNSPRANMPFVKINCASISESLLESELFGYEKGAFTGAKREGNPGLFEMADKGTLLLDEISELRPSMQATMLRVLQDREIRRVGGNWSRVIDVRIIASTNQELRSRVEDGRFRADLYHRLNVASLRIPPLRERREDIAPLLDYYLEHFSREFDIVRRFQPQAALLLQQYQFPGNVRELRNLLEGLCVSVTTEEITVADLPMYVLSAEKEGEASLAPTGEASNHMQHLPNFRTKIESLLGSFDVGLEEFLQQQERLILSQVLQVESSVRNAAKRLKISHSTLLRKMKKYDIHG